jgi:hypothetical protein
MCKELPVIPLKVKGGHKIINGGLRRRSGTIGRFF